MTTLKEAVRAIESIKISQHKKTKIAAQLLGRYKNLLPPGVSSTQLVRKLRNSLYDKIN